MSDDGHCQFYTCRMALLDVQKQLDHVPEVHSESHIRNLRIITI